MAKSLHKNGDVVSGAVLTGLGVFVVLESRRWDYMAPDGPGPGFFPTWYGLALIALSIALIASAVSKRAHEGGAVRWNEVGRALVAWLALTACIAALKVLGFLLSFGLLTLFVVSFMYGRSLAFGIGSAAATSLGFYLVFPLALNVSLPVGVFGF
ncbi:MAG: tripartite tricarboxylate transporter TctB family protein [Burkholderiales bacterium]